MRYFSKSDVFNGFDVETLNWNNAFFDTGRLEMFRGLALNPINLLEQYNEFPNDYFSSVDINLGDFTLDVSSLPTFSDGPLSNSIPGDTSTTATLAVGAQVVSAIDFSGDTDWFEVTLVAGTTYDISQLGNGGGLTDPFVRIMNAAGAELANNDDIILGDFRDSLLVFTASTSGTYYISAEAFSTNTGSYTLSLSEANTGEVAASTATTASATLNGSISGTIETSGDSDWYSITLTEGSRYIISNTGFGSTILPDAFLELRDSTGAVISSNDDSGPGNNARLAYSIETTGTYYVSATGLGTNTGDYAITIEEVPDLAERNLDGIANFLTDEFSTRSSYNSGGAGPTVINFSFASGANSLSAGAEALARRALDAWASVANITFVEGAGDIVFRNNGDGAFNSNTRTGALVTSSDLNVESTWNGSNVNLDSYTYQTFLHEIGHALGLGHAGPYNGSATYNLDNAYLNDSWAYTVMSYFDQNESGYFGDTRFVLGPQIADIIAIQDLYGANTSTRGGDTVYGWNSTETDVHDFSQFSRAPSLSIYDTGGNDTLDFSGYTTVQRIDLRQEAFSDVGGISGAITVARGTVIENAIGGSNVDTITGNDSDNVLTGSGGDDILDGGAGTDYAAFSGVAADYTITSNANGTVTVAHNSGGADGSDTLSNIEFARFSDGDVDLDENAVHLTDGDDVYVAANDSDGSPVYGEAGNDSMTGFSGSDTFYGGSGSDILRGNDGDDTLRGGDDNDRLIGGAGADVIYGDNNDDTVFGGLGDDQLYGGLGIDFMYGEDGNDVLRGGDHSDNLYGQNGNDTLWGDNGVDRLFGGADNDALHGGAGADVLYGQSGNDTLFGDDGTDLAFGEDGDDTFFGGTGDDQLFGGVGNDVLYGEGDDDILRGGDDNDRLYGQNGADFLWGELGDDRLFGGADNDALHGGAGADVLYGQSGNDTLFGDDGTDLAFGEDGDDTFFGGTGDDQLFGGVGNDVLYGEGDDDILRGGDDNDRLYGQNGADFLWGELGDDRLFGGADNDALHGGEGADVLYGQAGNDTLFGDGGIDSLYGETGDDTFFGGTGNDLLSGGDGIDVLYGEGNDDTLRGGADNDRLYGQNGVDVLYGDAGDDRLLGGHDGDTLHGGDGADTLFGQEGSDIMYGDAGNDVLHGETGNDRITGGAGDNVITGGSEGDAFFQTEGGIDRILDFTQGEDVLEVTLADFAAVVTASSNGVDARGSFVQIDMGVDGFFIVYGLQVSDLTASDFSFISSSAEIFEVVDKLVVAENTSSVSEDLTDFTLDQDMLSGFLAQGEIFRSAVFNEFGNWETNLDANLVYFNDFFDFI